MKTIVIIPARGGSKRLPRKNLYPVLGRPMLAWVIQACQESTYVSGIYVSTEDEEIRRVARQWGAAVIDRPADLADDRVPKQAAVVHAVEQLQAQGQHIDLVLSVQPNSPELTRGDLDAGIEKLLAHNLWEVFSVDPQLVQNGAFRVMRPESVVLKTLSVHCGVVIVDCVDVHTREDVAAVETRLQARLAREGHPANPAWATKPASANMG